jgi:hypothetical protein
MTQSRLNPGRKLLGFAIDSDGEVATELHRLGR